MTKEIVVLEQTFAILKPDCVEKGLIGDVLKRIQDAGFTIKALKMDRLSKETAGGFYAEHKGKSFYDALTSFMSNGPCVPLVLVKDNAVEDFRNLIGATDPQKAEEGTIRKDYGGAMPQNIVHGSDSVENAKKEIAYFFSGKELVLNES